MFIMVKKYMRQGRFIEVVELALRPSLMALVVFLIQCRQMPAKKIFLPELHMYSFTYIYIFVCDHFSMSRFHGRLITITDMHAGQQ